MVLKYKGEELIKKAEKCLRSCKDAAAVKRAMAVILTAREGKSPGEAAQILGINQTTLAKYRREFSNDAPPAPRPPRTSNTSHLTWDGEVAVLESLKERASRGELTTIVEIKAAYEAAAGCEVGTSTIYRFLKRHGWRRVAPRPVHPKADLEAQEAFKKTARDHAKNQKR